MLTIIATTGCDHGPSRPGELFDVGPVFAAQTPTITHRFIVKNTTDETVRILEENHSCTCTEVALAKVVLPPGGSTPLTLSMRTPEGYSKAMVSCTVVTDSREYPNWDYRLSYESFPVARIDPARIDLGTFKLDEEPTSEIPVSFETYGFQGEKHPLPARVDAPEELKVALDRNPGVDSPAGGVRRSRYRLKVGLGGPPHSPGTFAQPINIALAEGIGASAMVSWRVRGPMQCVPSHLHFGSMAPGGPPVSRTAVIRSTDGTPFRLLKVEGASDNIRVLTPGAEEGGTGPAVEHTIEVVLTSPVDAPRVMSGSVRVKTDGGGGRVAEVEVPWSVFYRQRAEGASQVEHTNSQRRQQ